MTDVLTKLRGVENFENAIISSVLLDRENRYVCVKVVTDRAFSTDNKAAVNDIVLSYIPRYFSGGAEISKLSPDSAMIENKIFEAINANFRALSATVDKSDIRAEKTENGFKFTIAVMDVLSCGGVCEKICDYLKKRYCGSFYGECVKSGKNADEIEVEEERENIEYDVPIRKFKIENFEFLEGSEKRGEAVYLADLNFAGENVVICGEIQDIRERVYTRGEREKTYFNFVISDGTANFRVTYFTRVKSIDKIKELKVGDSVVFTGKNEEFNGSLRYTATTVDYGTPPANFVPEKKASKPVPKYYSVIAPKPYCDIEQTDFFSDNFIPDCLKQNEFVVVDLETTGLNTSAVSGNMDKIIEIGAFKVKNGAIAESFTTFINPERKLSEEIINLTGITEDMVVNAPVCEKVMPDFFKFCEGAILVGHNIAGFDYKFIDYYCAHEGYMFERKIIDTIPLAQELLKLSNYKLNTVADRFGITFNHHRAIDDALVTAKIFIELIKIKKTLPKLS